MTIVKNILEKGLDYKFTLQDYLQEKGLPKEMTFTELQAKWLNETEGDMHIKDGYLCPKCKNKGLLYTVRNDEIISYWCSCRDIRKSLNIIKESGLEATVNKKTFDTFIAKEEWQKNIKDCAYDFIKSTANNVFFIGGQSGCGKTHLCTAICNELMKRGYPTLYFMWTTEARRLKSLSNDISYTQAIQPFKDVKVLYIDDFLKVMSGTNPTPADINVAFEILNYRLQNPDKITVISSEFDIDEILSLDEATGSRIVQGAGKYIKYIKKNSQKNQRLR